MMPKLTLQFEGRILKEYVVGAGLTIGRLPDNTVVIDNPAVSGHHARVFFDGQAVVIEDLKSTNGTYVNEQHVYRHTLRDGDEVLIGKHLLVFDRAGESKAAAPEPVLNGLGDTLYLDTRRHRTLLATLRQTRNQSAASAGAAGQGYAGAAGVLRVIDGLAERSIYELDAHTSLIGKSKTALVRLRGWFKPDVAMAIARNGNGYVATPIGGKPHVNNQPLVGRHHLEDGDVLSVGGLTLEFSLNGEATPDTVPADRDHVGARFMSSGQRAATFRALT